MSNFNEGKNTHINFLFNRNFGSLENTITISPFVVIGSHNYLLLRIEKLTKKARIHY